MTENIIFLSPVFTHNIWGGTKLREAFGYEIEGTDIGECWGIAAHEHGDCKIKNGKYKGRTLSQMWKECPEFFGFINTQEKFPLLVKILDAKEDLSIQVHPDDSYAKKYEAGSLGKAECWYVLDCAPDAKLIVGHHAKSREELEKMIRAGQWKQLIREIPVKRGDFIQLNPGTMHAIKGGNLLLETQQNSDITYRVYDYERLSNGKPRELHIEKSLDVIEAPAADISEYMLEADRVPENQFYELICCEHYKVYKIVVDKQMEERQTHPFLLMSVIEGAGKINGCSIVKGDHFIVSGRCENVNLEGNMQIIASTI